MDEAALRGRVALVTGGGTGLGRAIAERLAVHGCTVAVHHATSADGARAALEAIRGAGGAGVALACDLSDPEARAGFPTEVERAVGPVDVLVNNAARTQFIPFEDLARATDDVWRWVFELNVFAAAALLRATLPGMAARGFGRVLNVASTSALEPGGSSLPYAASKSALVALTRGLAAVAPAGVTINAVAPGWMDTDWAVRQGGEPAGDRAEATVEQVAEVAVDLVGSPAVNGEVVVVDGGTRWRRRHG